MRRPVVIYSVGYEGRDLESFVDALRDHDVEVLVDVRQTPSSRIRGFSKNRLAQALSDAGIDYRHVRELGVPREERAGIRSGDEDVRGRFRSRLEGESRPAVEELVSLAEERAVAVLCLERDDTNCHRRIVIEVARGIAPALEVTPIP